jgi:HEAT repeat protein
MNRAVNYYSLVFLVVLVVVFTGCSREQSRWEDIKKINTIEAYENYLKQYPDGKFADYAQSRLIQLKRKIVIEVKQSYGEAEGITLPFERDIAKFCEYADLNDIIIRIRVKGEALGANYKSMRSFSGGFYYTGARLIGNFSLDSPKGVFVREDHFEEEISPSSIISGYSSKTSPRKAPFSELYEIYWLPLFAEMLGEVYGADPLIRALDDRDWYVHFAAAKALGRLKDVRAVSYLIAAMCGKDSYIRNEAINTLEIIGKPAVNILISNLNNEYKGEEEDIREGIIIALGKIGDTKAVDPLVEFLKSGSYSERAMAATALGNIGDNRAVSPLIDALHDKEGYVRRMAASALGKIKDSRAVKPLITAIIRDTAGPEIEAYTEALNNITGLGFMPNPDDWQQWWDKNKDTYLNNK